MLCLWWPIRAAGHHVVFNYHTIDTQRYTDLPCQIQQFVFWIRPHLTICSKWLFFVASLTFNECSKNITVNLSIAQKCGQPKLYGSSFYFYNCSMVLWAQIYLDEIITFIWKSLKSDEISDSSFRGFNCRLP